jgi:hypothetical protein
MYKGEGNAREISWYCLKWRDESEGKIDVERKERGHSRFRLEKAEGKGKRKLRHSLFCYVEFQCMQRLV